MEHIAMHKLSKTHTSLLPKVSNSLCCGNPNSTVYFYHSDHLGSASWITNDSGNPVQHLQYMPYGEPFVNERTGSYEERFTFTSKERDSETGYGYFGARYYDSDLMTGWLSVDPLADDFSNISPYNYCNWNPVKLKDPDGNIPLLANIAGAALGAAVEIAGQVVSNYFAKEPIGNINWTSVGISAVEGALTAGGSVVKNLGVKTAAIAARSYSKCEGSIEKFYNEVAEEAVGELLTLGVKVKGPKPKTKRNTQAVAKVKEKGYVSSKQASEINAKNQAQNKKNIKKATKVKDAEEKLAKEGVKLAVEAGGAFVKKQNK